MGLMGERVIGNWKPSRTEAKIARAVQRFTRQKAENDHKAAVRKRDGRRCRFPFCACGKFRLRLEVSHDKHKGSGGDPTGVRSTPDRMILLCLHRHQDGIVSRHHQTLRTVYLTDRSNNGPIAFQVKTAALRTVVPHFVESWHLENGEGTLPIWYEIARESSIQVIGPLSDLQLVTLTVLGKMEA